jgi:hypothetical protein
MVGAASATDGTVHARGERNDVRGREVHHGWRQAFLLLCHLARRSNYSAGRGHLRSGDRSRRHPSAWRTGAALPTCRRGVPMVWHKRLSRYLYGRKPPGWAIPRQGLSTGKFLPAAELIRANHPARKYHPERAGYRPPGLPASTRRIQPTPSQTGCWRRASVGTSC